MKLLQTMACMLALCALTLCGSARPASAAAKEVKLLFPEPYSSASSYAEGQAVGIYYGALDFNMQNHPALRGKYKMRWVGDVVKSPADAINAVATGAGQFTYTLPQFIEQFDPDWRVITAPGVFKDMAHFLRAMDTPAWKAKQESLAETKGFRILKWTNSIGHFWIWTKNGPADSLAAMKNQKIRYSGQQSYANAFKALGLVGVALPVWSAKRGDKVAREYRQALADTNSYVLESLRGLRDTLQYQDTAARAAGITAHSETLGEKQKALKYREGLTVAITNTLILFTVIAVLGVSLQLYRNGQMGEEGVLICTLSALSSFGPVVALANLGASLTQVFASADRVLDLLDEEPVTADVTDGAHTAFAGAQAEHVSFSYADEEVLHDLSLTIPEKKIVGITGRSGSGKSTFLRLLMRFWDVNTGTIRFGEEDIRRVNTATLRAQESLVTQETELFNDTIENNIRIAKRDATREEVKAACKKAALDGFIRSLPKGYDTPVGELGGALSGGERQRIGVARAFLHDAPFLLLDEPTSNLDSLNEGVILKAVRAECRDKTVLLVSHRKSTMAAADVTYSVESGRLS